MYSAICTYALALTFIIKSSSKTTTSSAERERERERERGADGEGTISRLSEHCKLPVVEARARLRLQIEACKIHFLQSLGGGSEGTQTCLVHLLARPPTLGTRTSGLDPTEFAYNPLPGLVAEAIGVKDEQARFKED